MPPPPPPRKIEMKPRQAGNAAFAAGDFEQALAHYDAALTEENETAVSTLQCNRATCLVKLAARDVSDDSKNKAWLQRAEAACDAALDADPRNSKARYRLAQTLAALGDERLGEAIAAARSARRAIIDEKAGDAQRGAVADLLLALLDRDKAATDKTSRIARGLLRARRGGKGHEMTRGWKKPGTGEKKKAAVQKGFMDPKPRDYASSDDELVVEDVTKTVDEDASDSDEAPTAVVDAAADSDDDELMAVRKAEDDQRKARRKARIVAKENKKASEKPSEKAARKAARVQRILKMSMS
jgi:tetratricopeptide (TPR) repeat protein